MSAKSKREWTGEEAKTYAKHCVFESTTIGSEAWCNNLDETPKGEWTTQEVADYAKHCIVEAPKQSVTPSVAATVTAPSLDRGTTLCPGPRRAQSGSLPGETIDWLLIC